METMAHVEAHVHVNQVGYLPGESKRAVVPAFAPVPGGAFSIVDEDSTPKYATRPNCARTKAFPGRRMAGFPITSWPTSTTSTDRAATVCACPTA